MSASIFNIPSSSSTIPKVLFTHAELSSRYLDPIQPPTKAVPFRQIRNVKFVKDVKVCMPRWLWRTLYAESDGVGDAQLDVDVTSVMPKLRYAKVSMTLKELLDNEEIRRGNYLLLSSSPSSSTTISLDSGNLTIDMPQHIHQQSGLASSSTTKILSGGRKHDPKSARYRVEMDLRQPSMVKGKKGFDRLMYAAKNVEGLKDKRVWLFYDLSLCEKDVHGLAGKKRKRGEADGETTRGNDTSLSTTTSRPTETSDSVEPSHHVNTSTITSTRPLSSFNPTIFSDTGTSHIVSDILTPTFLTDPQFFSSISSISSRSDNNENNGGSKCGLPTILEDDFHEIIEYLSLLFLESPRITKAGYGPDRINPYLCQYTLPDISSTVSTRKPPSSEIIADDNMDSGSGDGGPAQQIPPLTISGTRSGGQEVVSTEDVHHTSYSGFMASTFVTQLVVDIIRRSRKIPRSRLRTEPTSSNDRPSSGHDGDGGSDKHPWVAIQFTAHKTDAQGGTDGCMILLQADDGSINTSAGVPMDVSEMDMDDERSEQADEMTAVEGRQGGDGTNNDDQPEASDVMMSGEAAAAIKDGEGEEDSDKEQQRKSRTVVANGFRYVTCFEFVDGLIG